MFWKKGLISLSYYKVLTERTKSQEESSLSFYSQVKLEMIEVLHIHYITIKYLCFDIVACLFIYTFNDETKLSKWTCDLIIQTSNNKYQMRFCSDFTPFGLLI